MEADNEAACDDCERFRQMIPITNSKVWEPVLLVILERIQRSAMRITDGELMRSDWISCGLKCAHCGRCFRVEIDTCHGSCGAVTPVPATGQ